MLNTSLWLVISQFCAIISHPNIQTIAELFEIKDRQQDKLIVYVLQEQAKNFKRLAPEARLLNSDINFEIRTKQLNGYHNLQQVKDLYYQLASQHSAIAKIEKYGSSRQGKQLFALKVSDNVLADENEPKVLFTSATHGDELITVEVQLRLVRELIKGVESDPRLRKMIEGRALYFIPVVNPDGFVRRSRYASNRVDPNRDYPWPDRPNRISRVKSIGHLIEYFQKNQFKGSMDIHASGKMVMFPWGFTRKPINSADYQKMDQLTKNMAKENRYRQGPISKVIYVAKGSSADYYYWKNSTMALAVELTTSKVPSASKIPQVVAEAREMVWKFIESF